MTASNRKGAKRIFWTALVALTLSGIIAAPRILSAAYHLLYGNVFSTEGLQVSVPPTFFALQPKRRPDHSIVTFFSYSVGFPFRSRYAATISFHELPQGHAFDSGRDTKLLDSTIAAAAEEGYKLGATSQPEIAHRSGYCLHFASDKQTEILRRCFVEGSRIIIYFRGDRRYLSDFEYVMRGTAMEASADK